MKDSVRTTIGPFAITPLWLLKSGISPAAIVAWGVLWAKWADKDGKCWPSHSTVAAEMGVTDRSVRNYITELEEIGALRVVNRARDDGAQTSNLYILDPTDPETRFQGGGKNLPGGVEMGDQGGWNELSDEPDPEEPDPMNHPSSAPSEPTAATSADVIMLEDYDKSKSSGAESPDVGAGLSHPSSTMPEELARARTILIEEGHDPEGVEKALLGTEAGEVVPAKWTTHRGDPYDAEVLAESVRLAVAFADACDEAGNKRPNPYTSKECHPMRLLLTNDEKPAKHIRLLIRWTFEDTFWYSNVLCARKFREKWDQLAGARRRELNKDQRRADRDKGAEGEDWMARRSYG